MTTILDELDDIVWATNDHDYGHQLHDAGLPDTYCSNDTQRNGYYKAHCETMTEEQLRLEHKLCRSRSRQDIINSVLNRKVTQ